MAELPKTMRAMQIQKQGPIEVLEVRDDVPLPECGPDDVIIKVEWAGINLCVPAHSTRADHSASTHVRSLELCRPDRADQRGGVYKIATPVVLGNETAGTLVKLGANVKPAQYGFDVGDRVAAYHALTGFGQYSRSTARTCIKLPDGISTKLAATALLQGLTALSFVTEAHTVKAGEHILVHAAAGALGQIICQLAKARGAHVIGTTSTEAKAETARKAGCEHVVLYKDVSMDEVAKQVVKLTPDGKGVAAVFDGVGASTFDMNFDVLARKGSLVSIGNASGAVPPCVAIVPPR